MKKHANLELTNHKLTLGRQTIAVLSASQLGDVAGGALPVTSNHTLCRTTTA